MSLPDTLRREAPLVLAALFISFVIWLIAMQGERDTNWVSVPILREQIPANMDVELRNPRASVAINVQFPKDQRARVVEKNFAVVINVSDVFSGDPSHWTNPTEPKTAIYPITLSNVRRFNLPPDVQVLRIDPDAIELEARLRLREVAVETPTLGELPSQFELTGPLVSQAPRILVTGSEDALARLAEQGDRLQCAPIDLTTLTRSGVIVRDLILPEGIQLVDPAQATVEVNVGLQERSVSRTISQVPIALPYLAADLRMQITPAAVDITIQGPPSALDRVTGDDFTFSPLKALEEKAGRVQEVGLEAAFRSRIPQDLSRKITILSLTPPRIAVEFVPLDAQNTKQPASTRP